MLLELKPFAAFKEYYFKDPDTGRRFTGSTLQELCTKIRSYRSQNELEELEYLESVIQHFLCTRPENLGACTKTKTPLKRNIMQYLKGGAVLLKNMLYKEYVTQDEADRRADICIGCSLNQFPDREGFLVWSDRIALATIGDRKSRHHSELGNCAGCSCPLRTKVWYGGEIKLEAKEKEVMSRANPQCWQTKISK